MIQLYFVKKDFGVRKAERWFQERRVPFQRVDLTRARLGRRELEAFAGQAGLDALIDRDGAAWKECPARYAGGEAVLDALVQNPRLLNLPIARNGRQVTVGYRPEVWAAWIQGDSLRK